MFSPRSVIHHLPPWEGAVLHTRAIQLFCGGSVLRVMCSKGYHTHTQWEVGEGGYQLSTTKIITETTHMLMDTKGLYFHGDYMSICVACKDETKAPGGISAAATVTRLSSASSWQMVALRPNEWHRQLPFKPRAQTVHVWPEGKQKEARVAFTSAQRRKEWEVGWTESRGGKYAAN